MNNVIMRRVEATPVYQPLADHKLVASVTLSCLPTNSGSVYFRGDDGSDVPWVPGEWHGLWSVNLNEIVVKGAPGDVVTGHWRDLVMPYGGNIFGTVAADLVQTDTDAIVQGLAGSPGGRTLAELHERIGGGLFDAGGDPLLERLIGALDLYLYNGELLEPRLDGVVRAVYETLYDTEFSRPWMAAVDDSVQSNLFSPVLEMPWLAVVNDSIQYGLHNMPASMPWLELISNHLYATLMDSWGSPWLQSISYGINGSLFNGMMSQPWLETLNYTIGGGFTHHLYDMTREQPWMESLHAESSMVRAVIEDVYDPLQHALRTV